MFRRPTRPPARTATTTLRLDTRTASQRMADLGRALSGVQRSLGLQLMLSMVKAAVEAERALARMAEVMRAPTVQANQPVRVAGLEARYYTRAALDPAYATPEGLRGLVRAVLDPDSEEAEGLWLVSPANRRLVAVAAMTGWAEHRAGSGAGQVCAHRQWGTTRVEVRCG